MKLLISIEELKKHKSKEKTVPCQCERCDKIFYARKNDIRTALRGTAGKSIKFCSSKCYNESREGRILCICKNCGKEVIKKPCQIRNSKNKFCCHKCALKYNNLHRSGGTRSRLEKYIEEQLKDIPKPNDLKNISSILKGLI